MHGAARRSITFGKEGADLRQHGQQLQLVQQAGGHLRLQQNVDARGDGVERLRLQRHAHAAIAAELVHQDAGAGIAFHVLEQQRRAAGVRGSLPHLGAAVGDLCHLQNGIDLDLDALQFPCLVELLQSSPVDRDTPRVPPSARRWPAQVWYRRRRSINGFSCGAIHTSQPSLHARSRR